MNETTTFGSRLEGFTDQDLLKLILTGTGPIADAHPELPVEMGFDGTQPIPDDAFLNSFIVAYLLHSPEFGTTWSKQMRSGDLITVEQGITSFQADFLDYLRVYQSAGVNGRGNNVWNWNVAVTVNVVAGATTFVGAATIAAVAMAVFVAAGVVYLDDMPAGIVDTQKRVAQTAGALTSSPK